MNSFAVFLALSTYVVQNDGMTLLRQKRQIPQSLQNLYSSQTYQPIILPPNYPPFTSSQYTNPILPQHPFEQSVGVGMHSKDGSRTELHGDLLFTIPEPDLGRYKEFDLKGELISGDQNFFLKFGETFAPLNLFNLPLSQTLPCAYGLCEPINPDGGLFVKQPLGNPFLPPAGIQPPSVVPSSPEFLRKLLLR